MFFKKEDKETLNQILQNLLHSKQMVDESFKDEVRQSLGALAHLIEHPSWIEEYKSCSREISNALLGLVETIQNHGVVEEAFLNKIMEKEKVTKKVVKPKKKSQS